MKTLKALAAGLLITIGIVACVEQPDTDAEDRKGAVKTVSCSSSLDGKSCLQCKNGGTTDCCAGATFCLVCADYACRDSKGRAYCCNDGMTY